MNRYGRDALGDDLSTFGGDGALLYGAADRLPRWLALGGDFRGAYAAQGVQDPAGPKQAVFPMQADLEARAGIAGISVYATGGVRGQVRPNGDLIPEQNYQPTPASRLVSREHYAMWQPALLGPYVRLGRFFAPFGLRLAEHVFYVRRDLGFNQLEESYNVSAGYLAEASELHLTAFAPDGLNHLGARTWGLAAYAERRVLADSGLIGLQGKLETGDSWKRLIGGLVGKSYVAAWKTQFFAEGNLISLSSGEQTSSQFVGGAGVSVLAVKGLMGTIYGERRQTDLGVRGTATDAAAMLVNWLPVAHLEIQLMGRLQWPSGSDAAKTLFAQVHYIL